MFSLLKIFKRGNRLTADSINKKLEKTQNHFSGKIQRRAGRILISGSKDGTHIFSGFRIPIVKTLPVVGDKKDRVHIVYWAHSSEIEGATGDGQLWVFSHRFRLWYPLMFPTDTDWAVTRYGNEEG